MLLRLKWKDSNNKTFELYFRNELRGGENLPSLRFDGADCNLTSSKHG